LRAASSSLCCDGPTIQRADRYPSSTADALIKGLLLWEPLNTRSFSFPPGSRAECRRKSLWLFFPPGRNGRFAAPWQGFGALQPPWPGRNKKPRLAATARSLPTGSKQIYRWVSRVCRSKPATYDRSNFGNRKAGAPAICRALNADFFRRQIIPSHPSARAFMPRKQPLERAI